MTWPEPLSPHAAPPANWIGLAPIWPQGGGLTDLIVRGRWVAVEALNVLYPRVGLEGLARVLGGSAGATRMPQVRKAGWWSAALVERTLNDC